MTTSDLDPDALAKLIVGMVRRGTQTKVDGICRAGGPMVSFEEWAADLIAAAVREAADTPEQAARLANVTTARAVERAEKAERVVALLMPKEPPCSSKDGTCCFVRADTGVGERWIGVGCSCQNYDDAQRAAGWADDMNRFLDARALLLREGYNAAREPGVTGKPRCRFYGDDDDRANHDCHINMALAVPPCKGKCDWKEPPGVTGKGEGET